MNKIIEYLKGFPERFERYAQICKEIDEKTAREISARNEETARKNKEIDEETARKNEELDIKFARDFNIDPNDKEAIREREKFELTKLILRIIITAIIIVIVNYFFY